MIAFPSCKINLGLNVLRKREDGYHDLETVFYPLRFRDVLEVIQLPGNTGGFEFGQTGLQIEGKPEDNLCARAYRLLKKDFPELPGIRMHLHKVIPAGAGLGGGSSDGAFALKLLNEKFCLDLSQDRLLQYASVLGSDCPFFIQNKPCFATGRGELLEPLGVDLDAYTIKLVNPGIHIDTAWAFTQVRPAIPRKRIPEVLAGAISNWKNELVNDFEGPVFEKYPVVRDIREALYSNGALYAALSGSGSTVFGIFEKTVHTILFPGKDYFEHSL